MLFGSRLSVSNAGFRTADAPTPPSTSHPGRVAFLVASPPKKATNFLVLSFYHLICQSEKQENTNCRFRAHMHACDAPSSCLLCSVVLGLQLRTICRRLVAGTPSK